MNRLIPTCLALGFLMPASSAMALPSVSPDGIRSRAHAVILKYRKTRPSVKSFDNGADARAFYKKVRRGGYPATLSRHGRVYLVTYRQIRWRQRTFTGRSALREATAYRIRLRRLRYETRLIVHRAPTVRPFHPSKLIGFSELSARRLAAQNGYSTRIVSRDGRSFPVTQDYRRNRINLTIVRGRVVRATIG